MAANQDKIEEKAVKELREKVKTIKSSSEIEKEIYSQDVAYKIKDETDKH
jgi:hypothetical protein